MWNGPITVTSLLGQNTRERMRESEGNVVARQMEAVEV
jgi:hypothetical protein